MHVRTLLTDMNQIEPLSQLHQLQTFNLHSLPQENLPTSLHLSHVPIQLQQRAVEV